MEAAAITVNFGNCSCIVTTKRSKWQVRWLWRRRTFVLICRSQVDENTGLTGYRFCCRKGGGRSIPHRVDLRYTPRILLSDLPNPVAYFLKFLPTCLAAFNLEAATIVAVPSRVPRKQVQDFFYFWRCGSARKQAMLNLGQTKKSTPFHHGGAKSLLLCVIRYRFSVSSLLFGERTLHFFSVSEDF